MQKKILYVYKIPVEVHLAGLPLVTSVFDPKSRKYEACASSPR